MQLVLGEAVRHRNLRHKDLPHKYLDHHMLLETARSFSCLAMAPPCCLLTEADYLLMEAAAPLYCLKGAAALA